MGVHGIHRNSRDAKVSLFVVLPHEMIASSNDRYAATTHKVR